MLKLGSIKSALDEEEKQVIKVKQKKWMKSSFLNGEKPSSLYGIPARKWILKKRLLKRACREQEFCKVIQKLKKENPWSSGGNSWWKMKLSWSAPSMMRCALPCTTDSYTRHLQFEKVSRPLRQALRAAPQIKWFPDHQPWREKHAASGGIVAQPSTRGPPAFPTAWLEKLPLLPA